MIIADEARAPTPVLVAIERGTPPLLAIREHAQMSPKEFADLAGVSVEELIEIEEGGACVKRFEIDRVAKATGIPNRVLKWWLS